MTTTTYHGFRDADGIAHVRFDDGRPLPPRLDLRNHSPTGFEWGYGGSGPAQLALALLAHALDDDAVALAQYQRFKFRVIGPLDRTTPWTMTSDDVRQASAQIAAEQRQPA